VAAAVVAQELPADIARCAAITDSGQRLACYDAAVQRPAPKPELGREELPKADSPAAAEQGDSVTLVVSDISLTRTGRLVLALDNGQVWQQIDGDGARFTPQGKVEGSHVTISRGLFGSYNLQFAGHNAMYKVRRVK
jgi:hypothetical protein